MDRKPTIPRGRQRDSARLQGEVELLRLQLAEAQEALTAHVQQEIPANRGIDENVWGN